MDATADGGRTLAITHGVMLAESKYVSGFVASPDLSGSEWVGEVELLCIGTLAAVPVGEREWFCEIQSPVLLAFGDGSSQGATHEIRAAPDGRTVGHLSIPILEEGRWVGRVRLVPCSGKS